MILDISNIFPLSNVNAPNYKIRNIKSNLLFVLTLTLVDIVVRKKVVAEYVEKYR